MILIWKPIAIQIGEDVVLLEDQSTTIIAFSWEIYLYPECLRNKPTC